jgi:Na+-transporting methylmalonyl-CoA/oxaloacetate decarboxylase beta subunit
MFDAFLSGLMGLTAGFAALQWSHVAMMIIGGILLYLGIKKDCEPLLLVPIGFGCILINIPLAGLMEKEGFLRIIYDAGIMTELFPLLIFVGQILVPY